MKLCELLDCDSSTEITGIAYRESDVKKGDLFFCLVGNSHDGHDFAPTAARKGAAAIVAERKTDALIEHVIVPDARKSLALASKRFYENVADKLKMVAITGTNGKTTVSYFVSAILSAANISVGVIGTNGAVWCGKHEDIALTTPDPPALHGILKRMYDDGVTHVIMEASAHALALEKLSGIKFEVAAFTNFTRDHLDFFKDMEAYKSAKLGLFDKRVSKYACVNTDDIVGQEIARMRGGTMTYALHSPSDTFAVDVRSGAFGSKFIVNILDDIVAVDISLVGEFNVMNALCALSICRLLSVPLFVAADGIKRVSKVDGRFNLYRVGGVNVVIDYAHTDDGLKNLLAAARGVCDGDVCVVFGCGGNRDRSKRPLMGEVAAKYADRIVLTSDNPRYEHPEAIMADIEKGINSVGFENYILQKDRKVAIQLAIAGAKSGDVVVIAGKGAEKSMEVNGKFIPFSDQEIILEMEKEMLG